jgi:hypothetical protein
MNMDFDCNGRGSAEKRVEVYEVHRSIARMRDVTIKTTFERYVSISKIQIFGFTLISFSVSSSNYASPSFNPRLGWHHIRGHEFHKAMVNVDGIVVLVQGPEHQQPLRSLGHL